MEQAYLDAEDDLAAAIAYAEGERDAAYADALADWEDGAAVADSALQAAYDAAYDDFQTAIAPANDDWAEAEAAAWAIYLAAKEDADDEFLAAEDAAWEAYLDGIDDIEAALASTEASIESQYYSIVTAATSAWESGEADAWDDYTTAMAALPGSPALGLRIDEPPGLGAFVIHEDAIKLTPVVKQDGGAQVRLNRLSGQIDEHLEGLREFDADEPNLLYTRLGLTLIAMDEKLDAMVAAIQGQNTQNFITAREQYQDLTQTLVNQVNELVQRATSIIRLGTEAADFAEGMRFRIHGIGSDMWRLIFRLGEVENALNYHIGVLSDMYEYLTATTNIGLPLHQILRVRTAGVNVLQQRSQIMTKVDEALQVQPDNMNNESATEAIAALNTKYNNIFDKQLAVYQRTLYHLGPHAAEMEGLYEDILDEVLWSQEMYNGASMNFYLRAIDSVADLNGALAIAREVDTVNDFFMIKGVKAMFDFLDSGNFRSTFAFAHQFIGIERVKMEIAAMVVVINESLPQNLEIVHDYLSDALNAIDDYLAAL